jgi:rSAM/selenodomain-associated transferase 2
MISVVIPTLNAEASLPRTFDCLIQATVRGLVREVIVADGGSDDGTVMLADAVGARIVSAARGRGLQLTAGADAARSDWLLFLHADTALEPGWEAEAEAFIERSSVERPRAGAFRFALDDFGFGARMLERMARLRCFLLGLPYGDQGLLISRRHYNRIGGYQALPLIEDLDIVRRIGRRRLVLLRSCAVTGAERFRKDGHIGRALRNLSVLTLYALRVPARVLAKLYG